MAPCLLQKSMSIKSIFSPVSVFLWLAGFACALFPLQEYQLQCFGLAVLSVFVWSYLLLSNKMVSTGWPIVKSPVLLFAGLFWILVLASAGWSEIKSVSIIGACFFSLFPLTFFALVLAGEERMFKSIAAILAVFFAVLAVWAILQFFFMNAYFMGQARHPLADPSSLGALFSLALFSTLGWIVGASDKRSRMWGVVLGTLLLCGMMSTVARGPFFALVPVLFLFAYMLWPQVKAARKALLIVLAGGIAFYGLTMTGVQKKLDLGERIMGTVAMQGDISNNRLNLWSSAIDVGKDHPWLGTGIGTFFLYYPEHRRAADQAGTFLVHNDPLQFWTELGVMGPLLFYAFVIAVMIRGFAALKRGEALSTGEKSIMVGSFCALAAMALHSHVSFNHYNLSILMVSGFLLALWFRLSGKALADQPVMAVLPDTLHRSAGRLLLAAPFVMLAWLCISLIGGEVMVNRAKENLFSENMACRDGSNDCFVQNINDANRLSQGLNFRAYLLAVNVPMAILELNTPKLDERQQANLYQQIKAYMETVIALNPREASARYYLGKVQTMVDPQIVPEGTPSPETYYKEALRLDPAFLGARMALLELYRSQDKTTQEMLEVMEPGLPFTYTHPMAREFYGQLGVLYLTSGNMEKSKEVMARAREFQTRSDFSRIRQDTSLPQALMGGDDIFDPVR